MKKALGQKSVNQALALAGVILQEDEHIISQSIIHGAIFWKSVAMIIFGMLTLIVTVNLGIFLMFVGAIMLGLAWLTRRYLLVIATDKRVIVRSGIVYADMIELRYTQIESVEMGVTPIGQIFGYGSLIFTGTGQRRIIVPFIANAMEFRAKVNEILVNK